MRVCPHCGFEADAGSAACPLCGSRLGAAGRAPGSGRPPAWEDPASGFPGDLIDTWRESLFEPTAFFRRVRPAAPFSRPLLYFLLVTVIGAFFTLWWEAVGRWPPGWGTGPLAADREGLPAIVGFFLSPFVALVGLAVWTLVLHLFVLLFVPERRSIGATARILCYAGGPTVFSAVPVLGPLVGLVWATVLQVVGVREVHATSTGRATAAVLLPLGLALVAAFLLLLLVFVAGVALLDRYV